MLRHRFDDVVFVFCEKEEAATLASVLVVLLLLHFENLKPIQLWLD